jgi:hypothetical protein
MKKRKEKAEMNYKRKRKKNSTKVFDIMSVLSIWVAG